ncbi:MAG: rod shape-determining protein RodA [Chlorobium sp.]|jgi:rod shape determining protein RodA|nr:MAG: rod shape-determining protein RodA [Chlorobium sp.]
MEKQSKLDLWLLIPMIGVITIGLMAVYSATHGTGDATLFYRQFSWGMIGFVVMSFVYYHDVRVIRDNAYIFYAIGILLLVAVLVFGKKVGGHSSWIKIGFFSFQPSEIAKMSTILALARFLSDDDTDIRSIPHFFIALGIAFFPALLIILQLDMGTTITCMSFIAPMLIVAGFDIYILMLIAFPLILMITGFFSIYFVISFAVVLFIILIAYQKKFQLHQLLVIGSGLGISLITQKFATDILKPHQIDRIQTFLDPMNDPQGAGYNVLQAKIAISSGGLLGKGFLQGTQTQLRFIPAQWTDFIFCVIGEELGFIGAALLLSLYLTLILRLIWAIFSIKNKFVELTLTGYVSLLFIHIAINTGMTIGLIPVIGVPLPFISYGGSSLIGNMIMVGLAMNFFRNKRSLGY